MKFQKKQILVSTSLRLRKVLLKDITTDKGIMWKNSHANLPQMWKNESPENLCGHLEILMAKKRNLKLKKWKKLYIKNINTGKTWFLTNLKVTKTRFSLFLSLSLSLSLSFSLSLVLSLSLSYSVSLSLSLSSKLIFEKTAGGTEVHWVAGFHWVQTCRARFTCKWIFA